jgi:nucleotide-binding universal stress UspA family protein
MPGVRRIIAGVSGSRRSLPALRRAADLADAHDATLLPVHVWAPPAMELASLQFPSERLYREWEDEAWQRLWGTLDTAFGGLPPGLRIQPVIAQGSPGWILVRAASRADDVLVIGAGRRAGASRLWHGTVSRYCLAHASCPVVAVPPSELETALRYGLASRVLRHKNTELSQEVPGPGR